MKNKKVRFLVFFFATVLIFGLFLVIKPFKSNTNTFRVGVRSDVSDWSYYDFDSEYCLGMEADIATHIGNEAGYNDIKFVTVNDSNKYELLENGEIDCLIYAYSDEENNNVYYSDGYYEAISSLICKNSSMFSSIKELSGKNIGVCDTTDVLINQMNEYFEVLGLEKPIYTKTADYHKLSEMLETGEVSAALVTSDIGFSIISEDDYAFEETIGSRFASIAVNKKHNNAEKIIDAANKIIENGTIEQILTNWGW